MGWQTKRFGRFDATTLGGTMIMGIGLPELGMSLLAIMLEWVIPVALALVAAYFVVRKAVRDELRRADGEQEQKD